MSTIKHYAKSIAATAADYRSGELDPFTADHVTTWAGQFVDGDRLPVLAELDHILKKTYFSERAVTLFENIFASVKIRCEELPTCLDVRRVDVSTDPLAFP